MCKPVSSVNSLAHASTQPHQVVRHRSNPLLGRGTGFNTPCTADKVNAWYSYGRDQMAAVWAIWQQPKMEESQKEQLGVGTCSALITLEQEAAVQIEGLPKRRYFLELVFPWFRPVLELPQALHQIGLFGQAFREWSGANPESVQMPHLIRTRVCNPIYVTELHLKVPGK